MTKENGEFEMLGFMVPSSDKKTIKEVAARNRLTISDVARMLIADGIEHIAEREILRLAR
jgi:hypothetical protein